VGNLTLLGSNDNKPGNTFNGNFAKKRGVFRGSAIEITREVSVHTDWSPCDIEKRQKEMARRATEIWQF
jgi:hypothetical protein